MNKQAQMATWIGLGLAGAGFLVIGISWDRAAELDHIQGQFPYLISGGLTGLGLIIVGAVLLVIQALRHDAERRSLQLTELGRAVAELQALLAPASVDDPGLVGEYRPRPRNGASGDSPTEQIPTVAEAGWQR